MAGLLFCELILIVGLADLEKAGPSIVCKSGYFTLNLEDGNLSICGSPPSLTLVKKKLEFERPEQTLES